MIMSYDSILGVPLVETGHASSQYNKGSNGIGLGGPMILILVVIILLFVLLFSGLGKSESASMNGENRGSSTSMLTVLLGGVVIVILVLNGFQYFFNINLTANLKDLFSANPTLELTVEQSDPDQGVAPVPEITEKKQVFHIPGNDYTYDNAESLCKAYGSRLATYDEVEKSYDNGGEWCSYGWSDKQLALFPTQKETWNKLQTIEGHENDCGRAGINGGYIANQNVKFGANCFGYKPKITDTEMAMMKTEPLYPKTMEDIKEEKQVDYWKRKIPEILVSPFNKSVWSLI
tara:strand:- start:110 stop:979 length:870 start_codon:yes stop_codon:yes gene_type:complete